jgi:hypothetical protein
MVAAQRQLVQDGEIAKVDVTLVDADIGPWGRPVYGHEGIDGWPEIKLVVKLTQDAADMFSRIDYLHVDADHSFEAVISDLRSYGPRMAENAWAITVHDTCNPTSFHQVGAYRAARQWANENEHDMITFGWGAGVSVIVPRKGSS